MEISFYVFDTRALLFLLRKRMKQMSLGKIQSLYVLFQTHVPSEDNIGPLETHFVHCTIIIN